MSTPDLEQIKELLFKGQKIEAIKIYREKTGKDLKDSKDAVDAFEKELRNQNPEKFTSSGKGCSVGMLVFGIPFVFLAVWILAR
jgi:hypothetical protein